MQLSFIPMNKYPLCMYLFWVTVIFSLLVEGHNNPLLLYSTTKDIRIANSTRHNNKIKTTILIKNFTFNDGIRTDVPAIDYHYEEKKICWADYVLENIQCKHFNGIETEGEVETITNGTLTPAGLACDWFTNKLYWTDSEANRIEVATIDGKHRKVLFWTDIDQPRAIALVPMKGFMFWTDWGEIPKIERAGMNGDSSTRIIIVQNNIFWPNGITVDYENEKVYWIDGKLQFIEMMDYNGNNRTIILSKKFEYPIALTIYQSKLFWTDWKTWSIHYFDSNINETKELIHLSDTVPMDIHVYDKKRQPYFNHPCEKLNGGCSHLCLLAPYPPGYSCACPIGIKLINNMTCANGPQELLLLARRTDIIIIYLDSPDYTYKILPLNDIKYSIAVDYDPVEDYIYWSDDEVKKIQKAKLNGSDQQDVVNKEIQHPDGISIDWISRNIYWTDTGTDRVEMVRLKYGYRRVIICNDINEPRGIAVAPDLGWLFWSDWYEKNPKIERTNLDGSERKIIINKDLGWPNGITLDLNNLKIYWCDAKLNKIEYANMDGSDRSELINDNIPHAFGFSLMGNYLYWTDWQRRAIDRAHKETGTNREVIIDQMANLMGIKAIKLGFVTGWNPCKENNGGCEQICFFRHNNTHICACEFGYELSNDRKKCEKPEAFILYTKKDGIGRVSIENAGNQMIIPVSKIKYANSIDYDINTLRIYWSDSKLKTIMRSFINGSDQQKIIEMGLISPDGIAIDWFGLNIYWTDSIAHRIEVSRLVGSSRRTLLWKEIYDEPHSIVLDPSSGYMYWTEWGASNTIKKSSMDGSHPLRLISTNGKAGDLCLDYDKRRLYWTEIDNLSILSSDLNGNDKRNIINSDKFQPLSLALYKNYIYWSEKNTGEIWRADKNNGSNPIKIDQLSETITDLIIFNSKQKEKGTNQCAVGNGGCSHLCLAIPGDVPEEPVKFTCACPTHYTLIGNNCFPPVQFMIYSQKNSVVRLLPDTSECPEAVLPIQGLKNVRAIDYDPINNFLYWIEGKTPSIRRAKANGSTSSQIVISGNFGLIPVDLAVDSLGRLLFWTCAAQDVINVTRLDNNITFGVVFQQDGIKPRLLAIHLTKRLLFFTDVGTTPQLIRTRLDGSHKIVITKASDIAAIAVDEENDLILWTQGQYIYISNIDGENQHVLLNESNSRISQLTVHSGWLYWIDREVNQLQRLELISGKSRSTLSVQALNIIDIISVSKPIKNHSCLQFQQKKCSHLCILNGTLPICACPIDNILKDDKRTCFAKLNCGTDKFTCTIMSPDKDCIPISWRCDGQDDCYDGSDEIDCATCQIDQFKCPDGACIAKDMICDGIPQCLDRSDESNCCKDGFQCPNTQVCLPLSVVCDKTDHCADGSDEHPSLCQNVNMLKQNGNNTILMIVLIVISIIVALAVVFYCILKRFTGVDQIHDQSEDSLSPIQSNLLNKTQKFRNKIPDLVEMSMINGSETSSYDRNHITGASSSTNGSSLMCYPRETLNPPPSPATTAASTRGSSPSSRYRPYRHYRAINQPPPPTPCSTDVCDESDYNYPTRCRYDGGPFPPPPTPNCHSESCPPSPSSRSSTYFSPLPPPPSPVASPPRGYDS